MRPKPPQPHRDLTDIGQTDGVCTWGLRLTRVGKMLDAQANDKEHL